jgi:Gpi18-like mannosyltransferase
MNFYSINKSFYPPVSIYIFWIVGAFYKLLFSSSFDINTTLFTILIKGPANLADIAAAYLIFVTIKKYADFKKAYLSMIFYVFNPAIIYNSAIWGQVDSIYTLFCLLALIMIVSDKLELAGAFMAIAILTKPQSLVILPFVALLIIKKRNPFRIAKSLTAFVFVLLVLALPFFQKTSLYQLLNIYSSGYGGFAYNSVNAFNLWSFLGFWKPDNTTFLFLNYKQWGYILFGLLFIYVVFITIGTKNDKYIYYASAILFFGFFMIFTRVHERYLFPMFAPLIIAANMDKRLNYIYLISSFTYLFNLYYVMQFSHKNQFIPDGDPYVLLASGINSVLFFYALYCFSDKNFGIIKNFLKKGHSSIFQR